MSKYEMCVWYNETVTMTANSADEAEKMACADGWARHGMLGGVHAVEVIKIDDCWTPTETWRYSGRIADKEADHGTRSL